MAVSWTLPTQRRGTTGHHHHHAVEWRTQKGNMPNGNWEQARRSGNTVQGTVDIDVATDPSTRLPTRSGMAHQRTNRGRAPDNTTLSYIFFTREPWPEQHFHAVGDVRRRQQWCLRQRARRSTTGQLAQSTCSLRRKTKRKWTCRLTARHQRTNSCRCQRHTSCCT